MAGNRGSSLTLPPPTEQPAGRPTSEFSLSSAGLEQPGSGSVPNSRASATPSPSSSSPFEHAGAAWPQRAIGVTSSATSKLRRVRTIVAGTEQSASPLRPIFRSAISASIALRVSANGWPWAITQTQLPAEAVMSHTNALGAA